MRLPFVLLTLAGCDACGNVCHAPEITNVDAPDAMPDAPPAARPSCAGLPPSCGPNHDDNCCAAPPVTGGTYRRSFDVAADEAFADPSAPATVSGFMLDRYEVTVGRFRTFVAVGGGTRAAPPATGAGAHATIPDSGWSPTFDTALVADATALRTALACSPELATWTDTPGANEDRPITCVTWEEALAFCAFDGGYLPTEAEWNLAAAGGDEQRALPWSAPAGDTSIDCSFANYAPGDHCLTSTPAGALALVGADSPRGDGKFGHADLAGNALEWVLDLFAPYTTPCTDCANLATGSKRVLRGGSQNDPASRVRVGARFTSATPRDGGIGFRCAYPSP